jgi:hypothetical protein
VNHFHKYGLGTGAAQLLQQPAGKEMVDEGAPRELCELPVRTQEDLDNMELWLSTSTNYKALVSGISSFHFIVFKKI